MELGTKHAVAVFKRTERMKIAGLPSTIFKIVLKSIKLNTNNIVFGFFLISLSSEHSDTDRIVTFVLCCPSIGLQRIVSDKIHAKNKQKVSLSE